MRGQQKVNLTIAATQELNATHPVIRINATELNLDSLRQNHDLENLIDEAPTVVDNIT